MSGDSRAVWIVASYSVAAAGAGIFFVNFSPFIMDAVAPRMRSRAFALASATFPTALIADPVAAVVGRITILAFKSPIHPALALWQMDLVRPEFWGLMSGFGNLSWALGSSGTALIGGALIANFGYPNLFLTGAALSTIGALLFGLFLIVHRPTPVEDDLDPAAVSEL
ncbi:MAG TPA: hypothetical protein QGG37_10860 [Chloroflexota bacterium]|nr:hypothetical protein [Chloroflexota bacterium]